MADATISAFNAGAELAYPSGVADGGQRGPWQTDGGGDPHERAGASHRDRAGGLDGVRHRARSAGSTQGDRAIDAVVPKDWDIVVGGGHQAYFNTQMRGRPAERYTTVREFGAVGNGLSYALGVAAARRQGREGKIVLFEGDGGLLFHIQELETLKRQGYRILICAMNDGGYGSEFHKLRADGIDDSLAVFGRPALEKIARGFDLRGHEIRDVSVIPKLFADFTAQGESEIWNIQISDQVTAPVIRQTIKRGHGNM